MAAMVVSIAEIIVMLLGVGASVAEPPRADLALMREVGAPTDGPALLNWLHNRLPADDDAERIAELVRQLGDRQFGVRDRASREIVALGPKAVPALKKAIDDTNAEIRSRARASLHAIDAQTPAWPSVAIRLREEHPTGSVAALLRFLAIADDETEDAILAALHALSRHGGRLDPVLIEALRDIDAVKRAAAAIVVGQARQASGRELLLPLLKDADPRVRLQAATGILWCGERSAAAVLPELLESPAAAERATAVLEVLAGSGAPPGATAKTAAERRKAWSDFCRDHADTLDVAGLAELMPGQNVTIRAKKVAEKFIASWQHNDGPGLLGSTSAPFYSAGQVYATSADLKKAWGGYGPSPANDYHFRFHRLLTISKGLALCHGHDELTTVKNLRSVEHRLMVYSPTPNTWGLLIIRVKGGKVTVAGLTVDRIGELPN